MANPIEQAVILAGGMGTRLQPFTNENPKPMYPINGVPFIEHLVMQVKKFGINHILILLGYMPEKIQDYLGNGEKYNLQIEYAVTPTSFETGERLIQASERIQDIFLLLYCDNYCPIDYERLLRDFQTNEAVIQISAYTNVDHYTKDNLRVAENGCIELYDKKRTGLHLEGVDIGYAIVKKDALELFQNEKDAVQSGNFELVTYPALVRKKKLYATFTKHRYYSIGSWARIEDTRKFFGSQKTLFLDRDGTINVRPSKACYVEKEEDFIWLDGAKQAIGNLKEQGYRIILVSNQPGIARGKLTVDMLNRIHAKMQKELKQETGYEIDAIYFCPHNWDDGCECRKPKPGMLYQAQKDFALDLTKCILIGDDERDIQAGKAAGCRSIQVNESYDLLCAVKDLLKEEVR